MRNNVKAHSWINERKFPSSRVIRLNFAETFVNRSRHFARIDFFPLSHEPSQRMDSATLLLPWPAAEKYQRFKAGRVNGPAKKCFHLQTKWRGNLSLIQLRSIDHGGLLSLTACNARGCNNSATTCAKSPWHFRTHVENLRACICENATEGTTWLILLCCSLLFNTSAARIRRSFRPGSRQHTSCGNYWVGN